MDYNNYDRGYAGAYDERIGLYEPHLPLDGRAACSSPSPWPISRCDDVPYLSGRFALPSCSPSVSWHWCYAQRPGAEHVGRRCPRRVLSVIRLLNGMVLSYYFLMF